MTRALLAIIVGVFILQMFLIQQNGYEPLTEWGAVNFKRILAGEYYRLFTAMFLHLGTAHIFFNGLALWSIGRTVESLFGSRRFTLIYFLGGLSGSIASFIFTRGVSVGASGAIFAIVGAEIVFLYNNRQLLGKRAQSELQSLLFLAALNFGIGLVSAASRGGVVIDNWGHIGGFFAGIVLGWFMGPQYSVQPDPQAGFRVEDMNPLSVTWKTSAIFAAGLVVTLVYALVSFTRT